jgi:hypothetical protein
MSYECLFSANEKENQKNRKTNTNILWTPDKIDIWIGTKRIMIFDKYDSSRIDNARL